MTKHTPGPWHVFRVSEYLIIGESPPAPGRHIARASSMGDETEANARLIAAAPAMLEALQRIVRQRDYAAEHGHYEEIPSDLCFDDWAADIAAEAIALATDDTQ